MIKFSCPDFRHLLRKKAPLYHSLHYSLRMRVRVRHVLSGIPRCIVYAFGLRTPRSTTTLSFHRKAVHRDTTNSRKIFPRIFFPPLLWSTNNVAPSCKDRCFKSLDPCHSHHHARLEAECWGVDLLQLSQRFFHLSLLPKHFFCAKGLLND